MEGSKCRKQEAPMREEGGKALERERDRVFLVGRGDFPEHECKTVKVLNHLKSLHLIALLKKEQETYPIYEKKRLCPLQEKSLHVLLESSGVELAQILKFLSLLFL